MLSKGWDAKKQLRVFSFVFILLAVVMLSAGFSSAAISAPQNVEAELVHNEVHLSWSAVTGAKEYKIYESTDNTTFTYLNNTTALSFVVDLNGKNASTYYYKIEAVNGTDTNATVISVKFYPPAAPSGVTATISLGKVVLSWNAVDGTTGYYIYRGTESGKETLLVSVTGTNYTDSDVTGGNTYYYYVTAYNSTGESAASAEVQVSVTAGGGTLAIGDYATFNTILLIAGALLVLFGLPIFFFGATRHKDVSYYAMLVGVVLILISWGIGASGVGFDKELSFYGYTFNSILSYLAGAFIVVGIILYALGVTNRGMAKHKDVGLFSIVFGLLAFALSYLVGYITL